MKSLLYPGKRSFTDGFAEKVVSNTLTFQISLQFFFRDLSDSRGKKAVNSLARIIHVFTLRRRHITCNHHIPLSGTVKTNANNKHVSEMLESLFNDTVPRVSWISRAQHVKWAQVVVCSLSKTWHAKNSKYSRWFVHLSRLLCSY